jgi:hypothetical protein
VNAWRARPGFIEARALKNTVPASRNTVPLVRNTFRIVGNTCKTFRNLFPAAKNTFPAAGNTCKTLRHLFPAAGNRCKTPVQLFRAAVQLFPAVLQVFPAVLQVFPAVLQVFPAVLQLFPAVGTVFPAIRTLFPAVGTVFPAIRTIVRAACSRFHSGGRGSDGGRWVKSPPALSHPSLPAAARPSGLFDRPQLGAARAVWAAEEDPVAGPGQLGRVARAGLQGPHPARSTFIGAQSATPRSGPGGTVSPQLP